MRTSTPFTSRRGRVSRGTGTFQLVHISISLTNQPFLAIKSPTTPTRKTPTPCPTLRNALNQPRPPPLPLPPQRQQQPTSKPPAPPHANPPSSPPNLTTHAPCRVPPPRKALRNACRVERKRSEAPPPPTSQSRATPDAAQRLAIHPQARRW